MCWIEGNNERHEGELPYLEMKFGGEERKAGSGTGFHFRPRFLLLLLASKTVPYGF